MKHNIITLEKKDNKITIECINSNINNLSYIYIIKSKRIYYCNYSNKVFILLQKLYNRCYIVK